jgi:predicted transcriptional regulator
MSKRLQVLLDEDELAEIQELARRRHQTTAAWVRDALRVARDTATRPDARHKLEAIAAAAQHEFPTADIDDMLAEIERGYADPGAS